MFRPAFCLLLFRSGLSDMTNKRHWTALGGIGRRFCGVSWAMTRRFPLLGDQIEKTVCLSFCLILLGRPSYKETCIAQHH